MSNDIILILLVIALSIALIFKTIDQKETTKKAHEFEKEVLRYRIIDLQAQIKSLTEIKESEK